MRILVVDDQEKLAKFIKKRLEAEGFTVDCVFDGETARKRIMIHHEDYDLAILDVMMPKISGFEICGEIRKRNITLPIIMLTDKAEVEDMVSGLNIGADDYLVKPFSFEVLLARIRAILRRPSVSLPQELKIKGIVLNPTQRKVFFNKKEIKLTPKEFSLMECLMRHSGQVLTREQIISSAWDFSFDSFANVVDVHITNLRKKIKDRKGNIIETVRGVGYTIRK